MCGLGDIELIGLSYLLDAMQLGVFFQLVEIIFIMPKRKKLKLMLSTSEVKQQ